MFRKYEYINQEPNYCVAAVLQMILQRQHLYVPRSQKTIIDYFTPKVNERTQRTFYAIEDLNKQYFLPCKYPLQEHYYSYRRILTDDTDDLDDMITGYLQGDDDYIIFGNYQLITQDYEVLQETRPDCKYDIRHCFLIEDIIDAQHIYLVSPETAANGGTERVQTTARRLLRAWTIPSQFDLSGTGYSIITRIQT